MEIVATQKFIRTAPRKLRLVADMVRKMQLSAALVALKFTPKYAAKDIGNVLKTALGNAKLRGLNIDSMILRSIEVNEGPKLKRIHAGSRGRANPYVKKMSHIKVILTDEVKIQKKESEQASEVVEEKKGSNR